MVGPAQACVCAGNWPSVKQAWQRASAVFVGTVEVADPDEPDNKTIFQEQFVRIRVDEAFKGVVTGQTIELHQGGSDCDAKFRTGQRMVFYLQAPTPGSWVVPACSHALGFADAGGDDLLFLRGLPKSAIGTRLSGEVELYEDSPDEGFKRVRGLANIPVTISGPNGLTRETVTNNDGAYEMHGLPSGTYSVSIAVPKGLKIDFPVVTGSPRVKDAPASAELVPDGGASVSFALKADTQLSGHVLDSDGKPMWGVCIDLEPLEGPAEHPSQIFGCSKKDGYFEMSMMSPGRYWLVARDEIKVDGFKSKSTLYYPGVRDRAGAIAVSIEAGRYLHGLDIRVPFNEKRVKISGHFQFADGRPVTTGTITFSSPLHGYSETTETSNDGSFRLSLVEGMDGLLSGQLAVLQPVLSSCPQFKIEPRQSGMLRFMQARPLALSGDSDHIGLKLQLSSPSCKAWTRQP